MVIKNSNQSISDKKLVYLINNIVSDVIHRGN